MTRKRYTDEAIKDFICLCGCESLDKCSCSVERGSDDNKVLRENSRKNGRTNGKTQEALRMGIFPCVLVADCETGENYLPMAQRRLETCVG